MVKKENKEESLVPRDERTLKMGGMQNLYNLLFETRNILRSPVSQDDLKDYITSTLHLKRISDTYDEETQTALEESGGDKGYASLPEQHRSVTLDDCHWNDIRGRLENLDAVTVGAMRGIELVNLDTLYGILLMFSAQKRTDKKSLSDGKTRDLIEHLSIRRLGNNDCPVDLMGDAYEILLKKFADDSKVRVGEFYTPRSVVSLPVRIPDPKSGETVCNPVCDSGGMLIEVVQHMNHSSLCCGSIFSQEKNAINSAIAEMNLFLYDASDFNIMQGDTPRLPKILQNGEIAKFDCVIANPSFFLEKRGSIEWPSDKYGHNVWGTPSDSCGDYAWIQHMVKSMTSGNGRMVVAMPQGVLFRGNEEGRIREKLVKSDLIEAVVTLGDKLLYSTGLSPCFLILRRLRPAARSARVPMVDGTKILIARHAQNILSPGNVDRLYELYINYGDIEDFAKMVTLDAIVAKDYDLSPNKHVEYHKEEIRPYAETLAEFKVAYEEVKRCEGESRKLINL